jgi:hypothetical protein
MDYRVHFLLQSGEIYGGEYFQATDDAEAIALARRRYSSPWGKGHEVWCGSRMVHRESYLKG